MGNRRVSGDDTSLERQHPACQALWYQRLGPDSLAATSQASASNVGSGSDPLWVNN